MVSLMGDVIGFDHIRRSQRLFGIFLDRFGLRYFIDQESDLVLAIHETRAEQMVQLAACWLELRTGLPPAQGTLTIMKRDMRRLLIRRIAETLVEVSHPS